MESDATWFLRKHDDRDVFGPVSLDNLRDWAMAAKISPLDLVSHDQQKTWERAPMIAPLHMDWLVEVSDDFLYGPTTIGTVQEFLSNGEIDENTIVINARENTRCVIRENAVFKNAPKKTASPLDSPEATQIGTDPETIRIVLQERILELEALVKEHERTIKGWQERYLNLREKYTQATGKLPRD